MFSPQPFLFLVAALAGMVLSLASGGMMQPDWSLGILLGALLARRSNWPWVLPAVFVHDLMLYWTPWGAFPAACLVPLLLARLDSQIGAGVLQRLAMLVFVTLPMLAHGSGYMQWLLTVLLCIPIWHIAVHLHDRQFV